MPRVAEAMKVHERNREKARRNAEKEATYWMN
jgi:hypothetical protein